MRVRWLSLALQDLAAASEFIARDNPVAASHVVEQIVSSVTHLARYPSLGRAGRLAGTRELVVPNTPYIIPYRVRNDEVQVLAVIHASRRWPHDL